MFGKGLFGIYQHVFLQLRMGREGGGRGRHDLPGIHLHHRLVRAALWKSIRVSYPLGSPLAPKQRSRPRMALQGRLFLSLQFPFVTSCLPLAWRDRGNQRWRPIFSHSTVFTDTFFRTRSQLSQITYIRKLIK